ncbi:MAG: GNAT family N-acetyltransferase [Bacteroidales bacterium]|nr:GNAT family N-acetyltransferase [Bacteroidales bacterium]
MNDRIKNETRVLWDKCFSEEDKRFVDFYFEKRYNENDNIFIEKNGKVVSALQLISYPFSYYGKTIGCSYLSGCCTDPDYRSQGLMNDLIIKALKQAKNNGACFAALIPASESLFNYYAGTNFVTTFDYSKIRINLSHQVSESPSHRVSGQQSSVSVSEFGSESESDFYEVYEYFNNKMRARNCCIQHDEYDFKVITDDLELFDNHLLVAKYGEDICGLAFCYLRNGEIYIKDVFAESSAIFSNLISAAGKMAKGESQKSKASESLSLSINILIPPVAGQKTHRLGMARLIDAETMLRLYAMSHPKMKMEISLVDTILPENNGTYYINNGTLDKKNSIGTNVVDIEQLTQALFGYKTETLPEKLKAFNNQAAFMSLMLD